MLVASERVPESECMLHTTSCTALTAFLAASSRAGQSTGICPISGIDIPCSASPATPCWEEGAAWGGSSQSIWAMPSSAWEMCIRDRWQAMQFSKSQPGISSSKIDADDTTRQWHGTAVHTEHWKHTCVGGADCMQAVAVHIQQPVGLIKHSAGS